MSALAFDIGTYAVKAIAGKPGKSIVIDRTVEVFNTTGFGIPHDDASFQKLSEFINSIITDHKLPVQDVRLSLPETVISSKVISLPFLSDAELASAMQWQAEQYIPIPPEQLSLEYQVLYRPEKKEKDAHMRVLLVGTRKEVVERYVDMFLTLGIEPRVVETQIISLIRALAITPEEPTTLIAQMGAATTQLAILHAGELQFITSTMSGGEILSKALERAIGLDPKQAEAYKRTYGLQEAQFEGKVKQALLPAVVSLIGEFKKAITFFTSQHPGVNVARILLSGGPAQLPGLVQYITQELGTEVLIASPFSGATGSIPDVSHSLWSVCVGLLMREES